MKKRILVITTTYPRWKNDTDPPFVFELCKRLTDDFEIHVLTPCYPGSVENEVMDGVKVRRFRYFLRKYEKLAGSIGILPTLNNNKLYYFVIPFFLFFSLVSLFKAIRDVKPDLIHAHWTIPLGIFAAFAKTITHVPYVVTAHGADVFGLRGAFWTFMRRYVMRNASAVTAVSNALKDSLKMCHSLSDVKVVPMGVDSSLFASSSRITNQENRSDPTPTHRILYIGRLTEKKGVIYLIRAMRKIVEQKQNITLSIVGSGELENLLRDEVKKLSLSQYVNFCGAVTNHELPSLYAQHEMFVAPSIKAKGGDTEGFGLTLVEANMGGCLVIASQVGGIVDIIENGETGLLVREKDPADIAEKVIYAMDNPDEAKRIASKGQEMAKARFDWFVISQRYASILHDACN
ncbi:glycosyltransferase family 4 protein [Desulfopila aestuarii]|uniref:Glycosyltransferase involved in cell wall bisynthesis n=1 Tax=Desulfopila aestuarii DSM 18488 TaxID=1121416 RepID=A0A1M7Y1U2_9BACT|nr:glycosyltransferase family 4 protein [Desulfopila aestuarii]SHO45773.1 Glycosyltransferase involved in cell wall bisynthesis [Desulfopila aestuarii DSM 18488]